MRRRHVLALVILALVVATVLAAWDALTLRTVEERSETDGASIHFEVRLWDHQSVANAVGVVTYRDKNDSRTKTTRKLSDGRTEFRFWEGDALRGLSHSDLETVAGGVWVGDTGTYWVTLNDRNTQFMCRGGAIVEIRRSPPWFTEEEILQSVEGGEE